MRLDFIRYSGEIVEFLNVKTLEDIYYGVLDLSKVKDLELKEVLMFFEEILTMELKVNYLENNTGCFRVQKFENGFCYNEFGCVIEADSIGKLKELVLGENKIWYVFDEILAQKFTGRQLQLNS